MFNKFLIIIITSIFSLFSLKKEPIAPEPIEIRGYTIMTDLNENIPFVLEMVEGHPFAYLDVYIYVNGILANKTRVLTALLDKQSYIVSGFKSVNETKKIQIIVRYVDGGIEDSTISFSLKAPKYTTYSFNEYSNQVQYLEENPIKTSFTFKGKESTIDYQYESINFNGLNKYTLEKTRMIDFSNFSIFIDTIKECEIENFEFRLYYKFEDSDLIYLNNLYTLTDIKVNEIAINNYIGINEYKFYIDERNGMIYQNKTLYTNKDLLPFFIPFTLKESFTLDYSIVFYDVGMNHNDYIFNGKIIKTQLENNEFGKQYSYCYKLIDEILKEVNYVS